MGRRGHETGRRKWDTGTGAGHETPHAPAGRGAREVSRTSSADGVGRGDEEWEWVGGTSSADGVGRGDEEWEWERAERGEGGGEEGGSVE